MGSDRAVTFLVLGNGPDAERLATLYRSRFPNKQITLGLTQPPRDESIAEYSPINLSDHEQWPLFQDFIRRHIPIDQLILVFTPENLDKSLLYDDPTEEMLLPLMQCIKTALFGWRREDVSEKRLIIVAQRKADGSSEDRLVQISSNAILGLFRSLLPRFQAVGVKPELVFTELADHNNLERTVSTFLASGSLEPKVHIIRNGDITTQSPSVGECHSSSITFLQRRLRAVINLTERLQIFHIKYRSWYRLGNDFDFGPQMLFALVLSNAIGFGSYYFALKAYENSYDVLAFGLAIIVARVGLLPAFALCAQIIAKTFFNQYITSSLIRDVLSNPTSLFTSK